MIRMKMIDKHPPGTRKTWSNVEEREGLGYLQHILYTKMPCGFIDGWLSERKLHVYTVGVKNDR